MSNSLKEQLASTPLFGGNASAVESLYEQYLENPDAVPDGWRDYFAAMGDPDNDVVLWAFGDGLFADAGMARMPGGVSTRKAGARVPCG